MRFVTLLLLNSTNGAILLLLTACFNFKLIPNREGLGTSLYIIELFFCKKIPLSRRVEYVMDGSMDQSVSQSVSESVSEKCMYVTPIRSDLL